MIGDVTRRMKQDLILTYAPKGRRTQRISFVR